MASIDGLTVEQCQQLAGVQVGNLILINSQYKDEDNDRSDGGSEHESEDEENAEEGDGEEEGDGDEESEAGDEAQESGDEEDIEDDDEDEDMEDEELPELTTGLYLVLSVDRDDNDMITDIVLEEMAYNTKAAEKTLGSYRSYQIYGKQINVSGTKLVIPQPFNDTKKVSIKHLIDNDNREDYLYVKCTGDDVKNVIFRGRCPARCREGWVRTQQEMHEMVRDSIAVVTEHQPVCPVCMGKDLMQEYQSLREILESAPVDIGIVVEFHGRLNPRRRKLGYRFKQFDEREWGYVFDDMDSEGGESDDGGGGNTNGWGYWPEALDPSSCVVKKPAADSFIATLPRKAFLDAKTHSKETECPVCRDAFTDDSIVAQLPCGHLFCGTECIKQWLKQSNSCPTCRAKLPSKEDEQKQTEAAMVAGGALNQGEDDAEEDANDTPKANTVEMASDGQKYVLDEDIVMTDVEDLEEDGD